MNRFFVKDRFFQSTTLSESHVSEFAAAAGDLNPIHHDRQIARARGFSEIVASGPHTSALLMGSVGTHFSRFGPMLGLEFSFYFRQAVLANTALRIEWLIVRIVDKPNHFAALVDLRGRLLTESNGSAVGAKGLVLVYDKNRSPAPS